MLKSEFEVKLETTIAYLFICGVTYVSELGSASHKSCVTIVGHYSVSSRETP